MPISKVEAVKQVSNVFDDYSDWCLALFLVKWLPVEELHTYSPLIRM